MKEKNIAFIIHSLSNGGAERIMSYLTQNYSIAENKYLIVYHRSEVEYDFDGEIISLDTSPSNNMLGKAINYIKRIYKLRKIKSTLKIEKSISMLDSPNIINILSRKYDRIIISLRNHKSNEYTGFKGYIYKKLIRVLYNRADTIVAISKGVANDAVKNLKLDSNKIKVIYNPIDKENINKLISEQIDENKLFDDNTIIITSGRLSYQKGQWHLLKAFKKVCEDNENTKLVVLGQGELENELKDLAKSLGIEEKVIFLGYQKNPFKYMARADIFVLSSLHEGFGNVITEAMACRIPVISTDCKSGPREILSNIADYDIELKDIEYGDYGVLIPNFDYGDSIENMNLNDKEIIMADAIQFLLDNPQKLNQYKDKGIKRLNKFDMKIITKQWEQL